MKSTTMYIAAALCAVVIWSSCKKDEETTNSTNSTGTCNFTTDVIAADGATKNIIRALCHVLGSVYFAEFQSDTSAAPTGVAMLFSGTTRPAPGTYVIVTDVAQVTAGKVYVEYYDPANAWQGPVNGTVTVAASGSQVVITFCSLTMTGVGTKVVSVRATTNL